jgi:hypothetical protein
MTQEGRGLHREAVLLSRGGSGGEGCGLFQEPEDGRSVQKYCRGFEKAEANIGGFTEGVYNQK